MNKFIILLLFTFILCISNAQTLTFETLGKLINMPEDSVVSYFEKLDWKYQETENSIRNSTKMYISSQRDSFQCINLNYNYYHFMLYTVSKNVYELFKQSASQGFFMGNDYLDNNVFKEYYCEGYNFLIGYNENEETELYTISVRQFYSYDICVNFMNELFQNNKPITTDIIASLFYLKMQYENAPLFDEVRYYNVCEGLIIDYLLNNDIYTAYQIMLGALETYNNKCPNKNTEQIQNLYLYVMRVFLELKNYDSAISIGKEIELMLEEKKYSGFNYLSFQQNLTLCYLALNDTVNAKLSNDKAVALYEQQYGSLFNVTISGQFLCLNNFGMCYKSVGDTAKAIKCFEYVINNSHQSQYEFDAYQLACVNLAQLYMINKRYRDCIDLLNKVYSYDSNVMINCYSSLAYCYLKLKDYSESIKYLDLFNKESMANVIKIFSNYPESEREGYWDNTVSSTILFNNAIAYTSNDKSTLKMAYDNYVFYRTLLLSHPHLIEKCVMKSNNVELKNLYADYKRLKNDCFYNVNDNTYNQVQSLESRIIHKIDNFDDVLRDCYVSFETIRDCLSDDECIMDFTGFSKMIEYGVSEDYYAAFILTKKLTMPKMVVLGKRVDIDRLFLYDGDDNMMVNDCYLDDNLIKVYNALIFPLHRYLNDINTIYYIPCAGLTLLNFDVLKDENETILCEKYNAIRLS